MADRRRSGRPVSVKSENNIAAVRDTLETTPTKSLRKVASELQIKSHKTVYDIAHSLKLHAYKATKVHRMLPLDLERRREFCTTFLERLDTDPAAVSKVLFSDESIFALDSSAYAHNTYCWSTENPHHYTERILQPQRIVVWCGLSETHIIGPYFFPATVTAAAYLDMLRNYVIPGLRRRGVLNSVVFQQDGAAPHTAQVVLDYLQQRFPDRLISFRTQVMWPPRSPDLNPLDFYLWGHIKQLLRGKEHASLEDLKHSIQTAVRAINQDKELLQRVIGSFKSRLSACLDEDGGHFQHKL